MQGEVYVAFTEHFVAVIAVRLLACAVTHESVVTEVLGVGFENLLFFPVFDNAPSLDVVHDANDLKEG